MLMYIVGFCDGRQESKTKAIVLSIACDKLNSARFQSGSEIEEHLAYIFNLREHLVTFGATVNDYQLSRFVISSLPHSNRSHMLKNLSRDGVGSRGVSR